MPHSRSFDSAAVNTAGTVSPIGIITTGGEVCVCWHGISTIAQQLHYRLHPKRETGRWIGKILSSHQLPDNIIVPPAAAQA